MPLVCWFHHFSDSRAEICQKFFFGILVQMMTPKGHFEINWPLVPIKSKVKISQNFVAFSEYMNFKTDDSGQFSGSSASPTRRRPCSTRPPERPPTSFVQSCVQGDIFRGVQEVTTTTVDFLYKGRFFSEDMTDNNGNEQ